MALTRNRQTEESTLAPRLDAPSPKRTTVIDQRIGERLRTARIASGLSLEALAAALGVSYQLVQKYECGTTRMSAARLLEAAHALAVSPSFFFAFDDLLGRSVPDADIDIALSPLKHTAIRMIAEAEEADVDVVRQMLLRLKRDAVASSD